ncbi:hypothetical protein GCM10010398_48430 [Streptomyces fimbriatus]
MRYPVAVARRAYGRASSSRPAACSAQARASAVCTPRRRSRGAGRAQGLPGVTVVGGGERGSSAVVPAAASPPPAAGAPQIRVAGLLRPAPVLE